MSILEIKKLSCRAYGRTPYSPNQKCKKFCFAPYFKSVTRKKNEKEKSVCRTTFACMRCLLAVKYREAVQASKYGRRLAEVRSKPSPHTRCYMMYMFFFNSLKANCSYKRVRFCFSVWGEGQRGLSQLYCNQ